MSHSLAIYQFKVIEKDFTVIEWELIVIEKDFVVIWWDFIVIE